MTFITPITMVNFNWNIRTEQKKKIRYLAEFSVNVNKTVKNIETKWENAKIEKWKIYILAKTWANEFNLGGIILISPIDFLFRSWQAPQEWMHITTPQEIFLFWIS